MLNRKSLLWFLLLTFVISWPLFLLPLAFQSAQPAVHQTVTMISWVLAMWGPGLSTLLTTLVIQKQPLSSLHVRRLGPKLPYLFAWLVPPVLAVATGMLTVLFGAGTFDSSFSMIREAMAQAPGGDAISPELVVALQIAAALTFAPIFNLVFAFGEELGWRGFLLPHLLPLGQWKAILLSSAIWGIWHAPAIVQGLNYPGLPVAGIGMMVVWCLLLGVGMSWLYLKTRSPWAPTLAHASLNATAGLSLLFLTDVNIVIGGSLTSVIGWVALGGLNIWLVATRRLPVNEMAPKRESTQ